jgi:hypothetical protein
MVSKTYLKQSKFLYQKTRILLTICKEKVTFIYIRQQTTLLEELAMYTTQNEEGILNNYASEPAIYYAEFPSPEQQQSYASQGAIAFLLVTFTLLTAFAAS